MAFCSTSRYRLISTPHSAKSQRWKISRCSCSARHWSQERPVSLVSTAMLLPLTPCPRRQKQEVAVLPLLTRSRMPMPPELRQWVFVWLHVVSWVALRSSCRNVLVASSAFSLAMRISCCVRILSVWCCGVCVSEKGICPVLREALLDRGIIPLQRLSLRHIHSVQAVCGCSLTAHLSSSVSRLRVACANRRVR
jgi:hypothetical protein